MPTLTTQERMIKMETKLEDVCSDLGEIKKSLNDFIQTADKKYATKEELSAMRKTIWFIIGSSIGFLVWALQSYVTHLAK